MNTRKLHVKPLAAAITATLCLGLSFGAVAKDVSTVTPATSVTAKVQDTTQASQTTTKGQKKQITAKKQIITNLRGITVVGIRASLEKSLVIERNSASIVSAVTAEDIGKFPSTNVAEAMVLMPGVTVDRGFGQGERVSINGTNPSLNLSFLDGHPLATVDWKFEASPGRGFNYSILAPGIVGRIEVYKTAQARLPSGSLGGTVIIHSRNPLHEKANTFSAQIGLFENGQAQQVKPNAAVFYSWKNSTSTFGIDVGASHFVQTIWREGHEVFGYTPVSALEANNPGVLKAIADGNVNPHSLVPQEIDANLINSKRDRNSILVNLSYKPTQNLHLNLSGLYITEDFNNTNHVIEPLITDAPQNIVSFYGLQGPGYGVVTSGVVCGTGSSTPCQGSATATATHDNTGFRFSRIITKGLNLKVGYDSANWGVDGMTGVSTAQNKSGETHTSTSYDGGFSWTIHNGEIYDDTAAFLNPANYIGYKHSELIHEPVKTRKQYESVNLHVDFNSIINELLFGARYVNATASEIETEFYGPIANLNSPGSTYNVDIMNSPHFSGFSEDLKHFPTVSGTALNTWVWAHDHGPSQPSKFYDGTWQFDQKTKAVYAQANFALDNISGNFGARLVKNKIESATWNLGGASPVFPPNPNWFVISHKTFTDVLPSFNLTYNYTDNVLLRFAASENIAWAPYNQMEGNKELRNIGNDFTGTAGNPDLNPYKAYKFTASFDWYFAPQSVFAITPFYYHILNYISIGTTTQKNFNSLFASDPQRYRHVLEGKVGNCDSKGFCDYTVQLPENIGAGSIKGLSVSYQQPFRNTGFGVITNWTYALGTTASGQAIPFSSKNSITLSPYYEKGHFSGRVTFNWRSPYAGNSAISGAPPATVGAYSEIDFNIDWKFNQHFSISLAGLNLLNEPYFVYQGTRAEPLDIYTNGRRYIAKLRFKF